MDGGLRGKLTILSKRNQRILQTKIPKTLLETLAASAIAGTVLPALITIVWAASIGAFDLVEVLQAPLIMIVNTFAVAITFITVGLIKGEAI
jgi:hypothetical protein